MIAVERQFVLDAAVIILKVINRYISTVIAIQYSGVSERKTQVITVPFPWCSVLLTNDCSNQKSSPTDFVNVIA